MVLQRGSRRRNVALLMRWKRLIGRFRTLGLGVLRRRGRNLTALFMKWKRLTGMLRVLGLRVLWWRGYIIPLLLRWWKFARRLRTRFVSLRAADWRRKGDALGSSGRRDWLDACFILGIVSNEGNGMFVRI